MSIEILRLWHKSCIIVKSISLFNKLNPSFVKIFCCCYCWLWTFTEFNNKNKIELNIFNWHLHGLSKYKSLFFYPYLTHTMHHKTYTNFHIWTLVINYYYFLFFYLILKLFLNKFSFLLFNSRFFNYTSHLQCSWSNEVSDIESIIKT